MALECTILLWKMGKYVSAQSAYLAQAPDECMNAYRLGLGSQCILIIPTLCLGEHLFDDYCRGSDSALTSSIMVCSKCSLHFLLTIVE